MSQETYDTRVQCPGGQFKGGSCDTMTMSHYGVHCVLEKTTASRLLLLVIPRRDPLYFSAYSGRSVILDPGVSLPLYFSDNLEEGIFH